MDTVSAAYVHQTGDGSPMLIAYRLVYDLYFVIQYKQELLRVGILSFDDILNIVPFRSIRLNVSLPLVRDLDTTLQDWKRQILVALQNTHAGKEPVHDRARPWK